MATIAINAGSDTNTALLAFSRFLELDPSPGRAGGQGLDRAEPAERHADALSIADQLRGRFISDTFSVTSERLDDELARSVLSGEVDIFTAPQFKGSVSSCWTPA